MEIFFEYNKKAIIDFDFLKESYKNGRLQGAHVLAKLLQIDDNSPFKKEEFNKNLFKDFGINRQIWSYITIFLKTNIMPVSDDFDIRKIMKVTTILGGIPSIDEYFINYENEKVKKRKKYNPQNPKEDHKNLFHWIICKDREFQTFQNSNRFNNYTACKIFRVVPNTVTEYCYFRKLKDGIDLSEEYESDNNSESESESEYDNQNVDENQALSNIQLHLMEE